jgi:hypothetical protein
MSEAMTRAERWAWIAGAVGIVGGVVGWIVVPRDFAYAWLAAFVAFSPWPLGSTALLLAHSLTGGRWGEAARPALLLGAAATPLIAVLAVPVVLMLPTLYPWARAGAGFDNGWYLSVSFFAVRGVIYLAVWIGVALAAVAGGERAARIAPAGLLALAVTTTFAAIDATMSLEPEFTSSIYGMIAMTGAGLLAMAVACALSAAGASAKDRNDLGKLLLALTLLWTYLDFMQLLIVWQSDLVTQAPWYLKRRAGFWGGVMAAVAIGHSLVPILLLLWPQVRKKAVALAGVAVLLVAMTVVRAWWTVVPEEPRLPGVVDLACLLGVGGVGAGFALWRSRRVAVGEIRHA